MLLPQQSQCLTEGVHRRQGLVPVGRTAERDAVRRCNNEAEVILHVFFVTSVHYLFHNFFVALVFLIFLILRFKRGRGERCYKMPKDVVQGGGLDHIAQQPVECLTGTSRKQPY